MKTAVLVAAVTLAQTGLASAMPQAVETVTKTLYQTVIWVDSNGAVVSTQTNNFSGGAASATATATTLSSTVSDSVPVTSQTATSSSTSLTSSSSAAASNGMGICYDLIAADSSCKTADQMTSDFTFLKSQGYSIVRTYDIGCDLGTVRDAAKGAGLQSMIGINGIASLQSDLAKMIGYMGGDWTDIETVYIGNELVNNGQASAAQVAAAVDTARGILKGAGYTGNVVTVDTFNVMQSDPTICSTSDYCAANAHAFFDPSIDASGAGTFVLNAYNAIQAANSGKMVRITESGWPYQGTCNGDACPSQDAQKTAMNSIMQSFSSMPGHLFAFMAYNAAYKSGGSFGVEPYFGIYDTSHYTGGIGLGQ